MARAGAFCHLYVKGAIMVWSADIVYGPLAGAVSMLASLTKEGKHQINCHTNQDLLLLPRTGY